MMELLDGVGDGNRSDGKRVKRWCERVRIRDLRFFGWH
jgi:hypothetical protein